jgi:hypothetical protein
MPAFRDRAALEPVADWHGPVVAVGAEQAQLH